ncbi:unnamed protein product [Heligmosomoides polygyrus]|uniref:Uncharacterized protein n=1 Tax=Heligmosomoides polygyrus TaxID=6339 RepID=A0A183F390_HELPZ|nr:unnamed protein product [Heligmosomoides polygyrus]
MATSKKVCRRPDGVIILARDAFMVTTISTRGSIPQLCQPYFAASLASTKEPLLSRGAMACEIHGMHILMARRRLVRNKHQKPCRRLRAMITKGIGVVRATTRVEEACGGPGTGRATMKEGAGGGTRTENEKEGSEVHGMYILMARRRLVRNKHQELPPVSSNDMQQESPASPDPAIAAETVEAATADVFVHLSVRKTDQNDEFLFRHAQLFKALEV